MTLEQVHEWIEDCETVIGTAMKSFVRKEREDALAEENTVNEAPSSPNNEIERSASMIRRKKMSLSLGELKKKEENTMNQKKKKNRKKKKKKTMKKKNKNKKKKKTITKSDARTR